jgi:phytoene dehydrogenase-like protein
VLKRRSVVGGAAVTEESLSLLPQLCRRYTVSLLNPKIIRDLKLHRHGLRILEGPISNFLPRPTDTI